MYLDHWALSDFSEKPALRERVLRVLGRGTLMVSMLNMLETARMSGTSVESIASFLDEVGSNWAPIVLSSGAVRRRERDGILFPWRDELNMPVLLVAPRVQWKPGVLVRRLQEPWAADVLAKWEDTEVGDLSRLLKDARDRYRAGTLKLDRTNDIPDHLDTRSVFGTIIQRFVRGSGKLGRNNIEDLLHTCVPVAHADVVFLDGPTKRQLLDRLQTPAKVYSASEVEDGLEYLEAGWPPESPAC